MITHGHEDHIGALPWVLRELGETSVPVIYGGQLTVAMGRSKLDEHRLREAKLEVLPTGQPVQAGPFEIELVHLTHSIPDMCRRDPALRARHRALHRRLQVRPDAGRRRARRRVAGSPSSAATACCCCAATPPTPTARASPSRSRRSARTSSASSPAARAGSSSRASRRTSTACSRSSTPPSGSTARSASSAARCARTSTSAARSATSSCPRARWSPRASSTSGPTTAS